MLPQSATILIQTVMGKFKKRHRGQTREPAKENFDSS
jgi:hypothetical protein